MCKGADVFSMSNVLLPNFGVVIAHLTEHHVKEEWQLVRAQQRSKVTNTESRRMQRWNPMGEIYWRGVAPGKCANI
jgi:hypothetical protein